jgi:PPOX class probable F420-dependent enzyme
MLSEADATVLEAQAAFLAATRLGVLMTLRADGSPIGVPVWYEWTGTAVCMFADRNSAKVARIAADPRASLLVANQVGEPERWVAFDGSIEIVDRGGIDLAEKLAGRYWDLALPAHRDTLNTWRQHAESLCLLRLTPTRIRSGS